MFLVAAACSAAAIFVIHEIESKGSPVGVPTVTRWFSPNDDGVQDVAEIRFKVRRRDRVTVTVLDRDGDVVTHIGRRKRIRGSQRLAWNGGTSDGGRAPEGVYHVRIRLHGQDRSFEVDSPIVLDITAPRARSVALDLTRLATLNVVRAQVRGADPAREQLLELDDVELRTRRVARDAKERNAGTFRDFVISASVRPGTERAQASQTRLVLVDRAGNRRSIEASILPGAVRVPARARGERDS